MQCNHKIVVTHAHSWTKDNWFFENINWETKKMTNIFLCWCLSLYKLVVSFNFEMYVLFQYQPKYPDSTSYGRQSSPVFQTITSDSAPKGNMIALHDLPIKWNWSCCITAIGGHSHWIGFMVHQAVSGITVRLWSHRTHHRSPHI